MESELIAAIVERIKIGYSFDDIRGELMSSGYPDEMIEDIYRKAKKQFDLQTNNLIDSDDKMSDLHYHDHVNNKSKKNNLDKFVIKLAAIIVILMIIGFIGNKQEAHIFKQTEDVAVKISIDQYCPIEETQEILRLRNELVSILDKDKEISQMTYNISFSTLFSEEESTKIYQFTDNIYSELEDLRKAYTLTDIELNKKQLELIPQALVEATYSNYCASNEVSFQEGFLENDRTARYSTDDYDLGSIACGMGDMHSTDQVIGLNLYKFGQALSSTGDLDNSIKFYNCAAEKYANFEAMYKLAQLYRNGSDEISKLLSEEYDIPINIKNKIEPNTKEALYWAYLTLSLSARYDLDFVNRNQDIHWNLIAMIDTISEVEKLSDKDISKVETRVEKYIREKGLEEAEQDNLSPSESLNKKIEKIELEEEFLEKNGVKFKKIFEDKNSYYGACSIFKDDFSESRFSIEDCFEDRAYYALVIKNIDSGNKWCFDSFQEESVVRTSSGILYTGEGCGGASVSYEADEDMRRTIILGVVKFRYQMYKKYIKELPPPACQDKEVINILEDFLDQDNLETLNVNSDSNQTSITCNYKDNSFAISVPRLVDSSFSWCLDSAGYIGEIESDKLKKESTSCK